jgi:hemerythrin
MHIEWNPSLSVGIEQIDLQHQEIFLRINRLLESSEAGRASETEQMLGFLQDYIIYHFGDEERAMTGSGYPNERTHISQHKAFSEQLIERKAELIRGDRTISVAAHTKAWLVDWWYEHIGQQDCEMAKYLLRHPCAGFDGEKK